MTVRLNATPFFDVVTHSPATGASANADSAPTFEIFEEATDAPIVSGTCTARAGETGTYRGTYAATAANGFEVGKWYAVVVTGVVGGITGKTVVQNYPLEPAGGTGVDVLAIAGSTIAATNLRSSAETIYVGTAAAGSTSTTIVDAGLTQAAPNHWNGRVVLFLTGTLKYQGTRVTAFTPGTDTLTVSTLTGAPAAGDVYVVL